MGNIGDSRDPPLNRTTQQLLHKLTWETGTELELFSKNEFVVYLSLFTHRKPSTSTDASPTDSKQPSVGCRVKVEPWPVYKSDKQVERPNGLLGNFTCEILTYKMLPGSNLRTELIHLIWKYFRSNPGRLRHKSLEHTTKQCAKTNRGTLCLSTALKSRLTVILQPEIKDPWLPHNK